METFLTKTMTIVALTCFLVVGAAATAILGRDSIPAALPQLASASAAAVQAPVSNKENKKDRLAVVSYALAAYRTAADHRGAERAVAPGLCLDRAGRYRHAEGSCARRRGTARCAAEAQGRRQAAPAAEKLRAAERHPDRRHQGAPETVRPRRNPTGRRWRPRCAPSRARFTRAGRPIPNAAGMPIDPEAEEVQQLKSAAMPLLFQLREDQKSEVRSLARIIGLEKVASMI